MKRRPHQTEAEGKTFQSASLRRAYRHVQEPCMIPHDLVCEGLNEGLIQRANIYIYIYIYIYVESMNMVEDP